MLFLFVDLFIFILGLVMGSFLGALTYRMPRGISIISKTRSFCPNCKKTIEWYDNIPLVSYIVLAGRCRKCGKKISVREPLIEVLSGTTFLLVYTSLSNCRFMFTGSMLCTWGNTLGIFAYPLFLLLSTVLVFILIYDTENMIIPDAAVLTVFAVFSLFLIFFRPDMLYVNLLSALFIAYILIILHFVTKGRGMGLGDAKLALMGGVILGWPGSLFWLFLSFVIGAIVGIIMIVTHKASLGKQIPFGPFLVVSLFIALIFADFIGSFI
jgi:leader peptidase (prepilin peptidase)/N-methyltransferase